MDQLLLPFKPTSPLEKVTYVGKDRYDGLPFLGYAKRKGKLNYGDPSPNLLIIDRGPVTRNYFMAPEEEEPFLQTWLFFGLLSGVPESRETPKCSVLKQLLSSNTSLLLEEELGAS
jgi:hypothetical protein